MPGLAEPMRLLTLNAGSGTLKVAWAEAAPAGDVCVRARVVRDAKPDSSSAELLEACLAELAERPERIDAVAHRVVFGGEAFVEPTLLGAAEEQTLRSLAPLAPLHLPVALQVLDAARRRFPGAPQVAVFDTAFHAGRAPESERYALPPEIGAEIRRYGFHGLAHQSLLESLARETRISPSEICAVTLQLGSGCSVCAIDAGRSVETSMGFTPLEGLVMATRSGDVDPGVMLHLLRQGYDVDRLEDLLVHRSGLLGLGGAADVRELLVRETRGDARAATALRLFVRRIVTTIGAYWTLLEGRGALVFGGGIGANSAEIRARIAAGLRAWNVELAAERPAPGRISADSSRPVYAFATDEEQILAREAIRRLRSA